MASFRKRGDRWQVQVRRGGNASSATFATKAQAQRWARRLEVDIDQGRAIGTGHVKGTLGEMLGRYEVEARKVRPLGRSKLGVLKMLDAGLGQRPLRRLTADQVLEYCKKRRETGAGPVTVGIELAQLGAVLRSAHGMLGLKLSDEAVRQARAALQAAGLMGRSQERDRRPTAAEIEALCGYFRELPRQVVPMAELIEFAIASAMRREEITRLLWSDLDPDKRIVLIRDRKDPRRKYGNHEQVPLLAVTGFDAVEIIRRQPRVSERIFPWLALTLSTIHARACRQLGIVDLRFHDYRHEGISRMFEAGMQIQEVAAVSGHKDWRTLQRYTHLKAVDLARRHRPAPERPATPESSRGDKEGFDPA